MVNAEREKKKKEVNKKKQTLKKPVTDDKPENGSKHAKPKKKKTEAASSCSKDSKESKEIATDEHEESSDEESNISSEVQSASYESAINSILKCRGMKRNSSEMQKNPRFQQSNNIGIVQQQPISQNNLVQQQTNIRQIEPQNNLTRLEQSSGQTTIARPQQQPSYGQTTIARPQQEQSYGQTTLGRVEYTSNNMMGNRYQSPPVLQPMDSWSNNQYSLVSNDSHNQNVINQVSNMMHGAFTTLYGDAEVNDADLMETSGYSDTSITEPVYFDQQCHKCCNCVSRIKTDLNALKLEVDRIKKKLKRCQTAKNTGDLNEDADDDTQEDYNGHSKEKLMAMVANVQSVTEAVKKLLYAVFSKEELLESSVRGKGTMKNKQAIKKSLDEKRREVVEDILLKKYDTNLQVIRGKIRDRLKLVRRMYHGIN